MQHLRKKLQGPVHIADLDRIEVLAVTNSSRIHHAFLADARVSKACGWPPLGAEAEQAAGGKEINNTQKSQTTRVSEQF